MRTTTANTSHYAGLILLYKKPPHPHKLRACPRSESQATNRAYRQVTYFRKRIRQPGLTKRINVSLCILPNWSE